MTGCAFRATVRATRVIYFVWNFTAFVAVALAGASMHSSGFYLANICTSKTSFSTDINNICSQFGAQVAGLLISILGCMTGNVSLLFLSDFDPKS